MGKAVQWPPKSSKHESKKDPSKWCDFHAYIGHTTNDCVALRTEVAFLLKNGYLNDFMSDKVPKRHARENEVDRPARAVAAKHLTPISFDESDAGDISDKHHDGLVISIPVGNCMVKRVLVDNGSSTNVMMLDAVKEMGLNSDTDVVQKSTVLIGFSGEANTTFGEVTLPIYAKGINQQPVKQKRRKFAPERNQIINDEVQQLLDTGNIREVKYPDWLANVIVVRKKNEK
ncbi:uncharacterized protein [Spinacia oleracea]|uniref:Retrotransposon gag domain-containing protein n=1 Tax=Spinacia oleracea TaxID=3562 RepID=A0ABM3RQA0_SPIOL|nr:uncharacterized protein LOC130471593 [Spinacia oleracea]